MRRLEAVYFGTSSEWRRLAAVLEASARTHCPGWAVHVRAVTPAPRRVAPGLPESLGHNTEKMDEWHAIVQGCADGDEVLLIDADTLILRPLDELWDQPFDLAYTVKAPAAKFPFNSGVVFLRVNDRTRAFVEAWWRENAQMLADATYHAAWREKYGGINQAALGAMLDRNELFQLAVRTVPCVEWNCEDTSWGAFGHATRIVHFKSRLRRLLFQRIPGTSFKHNELVRLWRRVERGLKRNLELDKEKHMPIKEHASMKRDDLRTPGPDALQEWRKKNRVTGQYESKLWLEGDAMKAEAEGWERVTEETEQAKLKDEQEQVDKAQQEQAQKVQEQQSATIQSRGRAPQPRAAAGQPAGQTKPEEKPSEQK